MSNSSTTGSPNLDTTKHTMTGVPTPGGGEKYAPKGGSGVDVHGGNVTGGNQSVKRVSTSGTKGDWVSAGGNQSVKAKR